MEIKCCVENFKRRNVSDTFKSTVGGCIDLCCISAGMGTRLRLVFLISKTCNNKIMNRLRQYQHVWLCLELVGIICLVYHCQVWMISLRTLAGVVPSRFLSIKINPYPGKNCSYREQRQLALCSLDSEGMHSLAWCIESKSIGWPKSWPIKLTQRHPTRAANWFQMLHVIVIWWHCGDHGKQLGPEPLGDHLTVPLST